MEKNQTHQDIAQLFLQVIPLTGRLFALQLRRAGYGLAPGHFRLLMLLSEHPRNITELAEKQGVSAPTMSNSISMLVDRGWAQRVRNPTDRRYVLIELTDEGCALLRDIQQTLQDGLTELCRSLPSEECQAFHNGLQVMLSVMRRAAEKAGITEGLP